MADGILQVRVELGDSVRRLESLTGATEAVITAQETATASSTALGTSLTDQKNTTAQLVTCESALEAQQRRSAAASMAQAASSRQSATAKSDEKESTTALTACDRALERERIASERAAAREAEAARLAQIAKDSEKSSTTQLTACDRALERERVAAERAAAREAEAARLAQLAKDNEKTSTVQLTACERALEQEKARVARITAMQIEAERLAATANDNSKTSITQLTTCERALAAEKARVARIVAMQVEAERLASVANDNTKDSVTRLTACEQALERQRLSQVAAAEAEALAAQMAAVANDNNKTSVTALTACERALERERQREIAAAEADAAASEASTAAKSAEKAATSNLTRCQSALATSSIRSSSTIMRGLDGISSALGRLTRITPLIGGILAGFSVVSVVRQLAAIEQSTIELRLAAQSAEEYSETLGFLRNLAAETGEDLSALARTFGLVSFAADRSTESIEDIRDQFIGFGRTAAATGVTGQNFRQLFITLEQITASGQVTARQLQVITNRIPNFFRAATAATGRTEEELRRLFRRRELDRAGVTDVLTQTGRELNRIIAPEFEGANRTISIAARGVSSSFLSLVDAAAGVTEGQTRGTGVVRFLDSITASFTSLVPSAREVRREFASVFSLIGDIGSATGVGGALGTFLGIISSFLGTLTESFAVIAAAVREATPSLRRLGVQREIDDLRLNPRLFNRPLTVEQREGLFQADMEARQLATRFRSLREQFGTVTSSALFPREDATGPTSAVLDSIPRAINTFTQSIPALLARTQTPAEVASAVAGQIGRGFLEDAVERPLLAGARAAALAASGSTLGQIQELVGTIGGTFAPILDPLLGLAGPTDPMAETAMNTMEIARNTSELLAEFQQVFTLLSNQSLAEGGTGAVSRDRLVREIIRRRDLNPSVGTADGGPLGGPNQTTAQAATNARLFREEATALLEPIVAAGSQIPLVNAITSLTGQLAGFIDFVLFPELNAAAPTAADIAELSTATNRSADETRMSNLLISRPSSLIAGPQSLAATGSLLNPQTGGQSTPVEGSIVELQRRRRQVEEDRRAQAQAINATTFVSRSLDNLSINSIPALINTIQALRETFNNPSRAFGIGGAGTGTLAALGGFFGGSATGELIRSLTPLVAEFFSSVQTGVSGGAGVTPVTQNVDLGSAITPIGGGGIGSTSANANMLSTVLATLMNPGPSGPANARVIQEIRNQVARM